MGRPRKQRGMLIFVDRWMTSSAFRLPQEARGIYLSMMMMAWISDECAINADHEEICRATGTTETEWRRAWPRIERYWRREGNLLVNDTLREIREHSNNAHEQHVEAGRRRAELRWGKRDRSDSVAEPVAKRVAKGVAQPVADSVAKTWPLDPDPESLSSRSSSLVSESPSLGGSARATPLTPTAKPEEAPTAQKGSGASGQPPRTVGTTRPTIVEQPPRQSNSDPAAALVEAWGRICAAPTFPQPSIPLSRELRGTIGGALKRRTLSEWEAIFRRVAESPFLRGEKGDQRDWRADLVWVLDWRHQSAIDAGRFDPKPEDVNLDDPETREFMAAQELMRKKREREESSRRPAAAVGLAELPKIGGGV